MSNFNVVLMSDLSTKTNSVQLAIGTLRIHPWSQAVYNFPTTGEAAQYLDLVQVEFPGATTKVNGSVVSVVR